MLARIISLWMVIGLAACHQSSRPWDGQAQPQADSQAGDAVSDDIALPNVPLDSQTPTDTQTPSPPPDTTLPETTEVTGPEEVTNLPPAWPEGASLDVQVSGAHSVALTWPSAVDDGAISGYEIMVNDAPVEQVGAAQTSVTVIDLQGATLYKLAVRALDSLGNTSDPLIAWATTGDESAPTWPPGASASVFDVTDSGATLTWPPATDNVQVTGYQVMTDGMVLATTTGETSVAVQNLTPWTAYTVTVMALDMAGNTSLDSLDITFKTSDSEVPWWSEDAVLQTSNIGPTQVTLTWPAAQDNGVLVGYDVVSAKVVLAQVNAETLSVTVEGLSPSQTYTLTVRAHDEAGHVSGAGPTTTVKTGDGLAPTWPAGSSLIASQVTHDSLSLAWTPANDDVAVTLYRVMQDGVEVAVTAQPQVTVQNLSSWTTYTFVVLAEDGAGNGSLPGPSTTVKTMDVMAPWWDVGGWLIASDVTPTSANLSWEPATDDGDVVSYRVTQGVETLAELPGDVLTYTAEDLLPWTAYAFRIEAVDAAGNWSTTGPFLAIQTPDEGTPTWGPGATLSVNQLTADSLTLTWDGASDDVGITHYRVTQDDVELAMVDGATSTLNVSDLAPWANYTFGVEAVDAAGNWSMDGPDVTVKTDDEVAPVWPQGAVLTVADLAPFTLTLSWPAASDDVAVMAYHISVNDGAPVVVDSAVTTIQLTGLEDKTVQSVSVVAVDAAVNTSLPLTVSVETPADCYSDLNQFEEEIWLPFMSNDCIGCHIEGGQAGGSQFVLEFGNTPEVLANNFDTLTSLALDKSMGDSLLLLKPTGQIPHGGGQRFVEGTAIYQSFLELVARAEEPGGCEDPSPKYSCENMPVNPGPSHLRRLTSTQYHNTILDLFGGLINSGTDFPQTVIHGGFSSYLAPNLVSASGAQSIFDSAEKIGAQIPEHIDTVVNCGNVAEVPCIADFIKTFGLKVYRRPLTQGELAAFFAGYQTAPYGAPFAEKVARLIEAFLQSPQFLYIHAEEGLPVAEQPGVVALSDYAMASRLSYLLWDSMPDQALFDRAAAGDLNNPTAITEEVTRMLNDPRAHVMVARFHSEWLHLYKLKDATKNPEVYPQFNPALATAMQQETDQLVKHVVFNGDSLFGSLMNTTTSFVNQELGGIYGVDVSNLAPGEWGQTTLGDERPGILTRAAFNTAHAYAHNSSPIHRGHFFIEGMLCQKLVIPPVDIGELPEVPQGTIKDRLEQHRVDPVCSSCHDRMDPLGLAFEHFDGIGQWRDTYANALPVDASGTLENPNLTFTDAGDLIGQLGNVETIPACYAKQWFRYASGRGDLPQDKCSLKSVQTAFTQNGGNIIGLIHAIAQSDSFRYRWDSKQEADNE
jgi:chitodextrinase